MLLIPAIDLKDGHCVRLKQGEMDDATVFSEDPGAMARHWLDAGARSEPNRHCPDEQGAQSRVHRAAGYVDADARVGHRRRRGAGL